MIVYHTLEPVYTKRSKTLILGSMPSIKSRELKKYYGHPQNRFWKIMEGVYEADVSLWQDFIKKHDLALWDVLKSCEIEGSSDSSIKEEKLNDIKSLVDKTEIEHIFLLGRHAYDLYKKNLEKTVGIEGIYLPSPSSANASKSLEELISIYRIIRDVTEDEEK